ncbi:MAG: YkgJ family cysteine cluster protein [bacterium]|nr:YkgJ family cysteine cluster protein [bacterium]
MEKSSFTRYTAFLDKIDTFVKHLQQLHQQQLVCRRGCSDCCRLERNLMPVEFHYLRQQVTTDLRQRLTDRRKTDCCPLLDKNDCLLYEHRPVICRTHGLPLLITEQKSTWRDCCPKNFTTVCLDDLPREGLLDLERLNTLLVGINTLFCDQTGVDQGLRLSLAQLLCADAPTNKKGA